LSVRYDLLKVLELLYSTQQIGTAFTDLFNIVTARQLKIKT